MASARLWRPASFATACSALGRELFGEWLLLRVLLGGPGSELEAMWISSGAGRGVTGATLEAAPAESKEAAKLTSPSDVSLLPRVPERECLSTACRATCLWKIPAMAGFREVEI